MFEALQLGLESVRLMRFQSDFEGRVCLAALRIVERSVVQNAVLLIARNIDRKLSRYFVAVVRKAVKCPVLFI